MSSDDRTDAAASAASPPAWRDRVAGENVQHDPDVIRLHAEEVSVSRERVETGRVHVRVVTREHDELVELPLARDHVGIERVAIGRPISAIPPTRQDGDTTIVPIAEEIVVVERRLMLKEELHIRRVHTTEQHQERVVLRRQETLVTRTPVESPAARDPRAGTEGNQPGREMTMAYETIVAVFDTAEHARAAVNALKAGGFHDEDISIIDRNRLSDGGATNGGTREPGLWGRLFGGDVYKHEADVYGQTVQEGGAVASMRVLASEVAHATGILDLHHPIDVNDRAVTSGIAPAAHVASARATTAVPMAAQQAVAVTPKVAATHDDVLRLAEEQLQVGKEMVETGRTRVRRFTTEREVAQDVTLHEEHAEVFRRAVSEPAAFADIDWADSEIEVTETAEHALVNKTARVVEEIALRTVGADHVETLHEKLRRQQAEVVRVDATGKPIEQRGAASGAADRHTL